MFVQIIIILSALYVGTVLLYLLGLAHKKKGANTQQYQVSVIIAARNEEDNIGNVLADLCKQTYPAGLYSVIVVNDGSTDKTQDVIQEYASLHSNIRSLTVQNVPPGFSPKKYALQQAIEQSQSEIILSTDADCRVPDTWIETMVSYFTPETGFVIGFSQYGAPQQKQNLIENLQAFDFLQMMGVAAGTCNLGLPMAASGQNLGYRRKAFLQVGGYKKIAHRASGDDVLMLQLVRKYTKYKAVFAANEKCYAVSKPQPTFHDFINQRVRWASNGSYQVYLNIPFFAYLLLVYLYSIAMLLSVVAAALSLAPVMLAVSVLMIKLLTDWSISWRSAGYYNRKDLLKWFPLWSSIQLPYVVYVGFKGTFGNFKWKGRVHSTDFKKSSKHVTTANENGAKK